jgi:WD40 repeat protein
MTRVTGSSAASLSDDGAFVAQLNGKDLIIHLNPVSLAFKEVEIVKLKETPTRFLRFSRPKHLARSDAIGSREESAGRRILCASDSRILVWDLHPLQLHAEIENIESGALNIDFGADENEIIVFHAWNTKLTIHSLDSGRSQVIKSPKFSHYNGFGFRPRTRQFAILLKPETSDLLTIHEYGSYELVNRANLPTSDAQGLKWSPDGNWIAVWDAASAGTKLLIYTADGNLFRTYNGSPESESVFDLGVRSIEWSPAISQGDASDLLAVGKVDGTIDILNTKTVSPCPQSSPACLKSPIVITSNPNH